MNQTYTNNRESGVGTVAQGRVERLAQGGYHVDISSTVGHRFISKVNWVIYEGSEMTLRIGESANLTGMDFKITSEELHLREPILEDGQE